MRHVPSWTSAGTACLICPPTSCTATQSAVGHASCGRAAPLIPQTTSGLGKSTPHPPCLATPQIPATRRRTGPWNRPAIPLQWARRRSCRSTTRWLVAQTGCAMRWATRLGAKRPRIPRLSTATQTLRPSAPRFGLFGFQPRPTPCIQASPLPRCPRPRRLTQRLPHKCRGGCQEGDEVGALGPARASTPEKACARSCPCSPKIQFIQPKTVRPLPSPWPSFRPPAGCGCRRCWTRRPSGRRPRWRRTSPSTTTVSAPSVGTDTRPRSDSATMLAPKGALNRFGHPPLQGIQRMLGRRVPHLKCKMRPPLPPSCHSTPKCRRPETSTRPRRGASHPTPATSPCRCAPRPMPGPQE